MTIVPETGITNFPRKPSKPNFMIESLPNHLNPSGKKLIVVPGEIPYVKPLNRNNIAMVTIRLLTFIFVIKYPLNKPIFIPMMSMIMIAHR